MVFSSISFLFFFLPITLILYYLPVTKKNPRADMTRKNATLFIMSLVFYAWGEPIYILLMLLSILFNYIVVLDIDRTVNEKTRKTLLVIAVIFNLFVIGFFKYYGFLVESINSLTGLSLKYRALALPVGISFYTFQILSYVIDAYRRKVHAQKNILSFSLYIVLFPQLIAGPIVQYADIELQLMGRNETFEKFSEGIVVFMKGFARKMLLANLAGAAFEGQMAGGVENMSAVSAWGCVFVYACQIYFDFSGYSDMAIGLGKMFGFHFPDNFNYPFYADSVADFWRRWHITLGDWFRDYVYIPLGGSRKGKARGIFNTAVIWFLTGLWHGAAWNYVCWGLFFGAWVLLERYLLRKHIAKWPPSLRRLYTILAISPSWMIFYYSDVGALFTYYRSMLGINNGFFDASAGYFLRSNLILCFMLIVCALPVGRFISEKLLKNRMSDAAYHCVRFVFWFIVFFISVAFLVSDSYNPFLYFRF